MIYGSVSLDVNSPQPAGLLNAVSGNLLWDACGTEYFSYDSFHAVFATSMRHASGREDVFYMDEESGTMVLLDGFIYNHQDISHELQVREQKWKIPQLIGKAWLKWGVSFAEKLNGDFVICIYLQKERRILFFCDHLGVRPLAVSKQGTTVYFSTDPMGLCKALFKNEKIDRDYLLNLFLLSGHDYSMLPNKAIFKIKPGHYAGISSAQQEHKPYWFPEKIKTDRRLTWPEVSRDLEHLLADAVRIRADQRFFASAHVSGGLDSSIVAVLARQEYAKQEVFYGFSWSPEYDTVPAEASRDERILVDKTCRQNGITPVYGNFDHDDYMAFMTDWRHPSELVYENKIVEAAKARSVGLLFSGWGGDEFISIADRGVYADLIRDLKWKQLLIKFQPWRFRRFIAVMRSYFSLVSARKAYARSKAEQSVYPYLSNALKSNRIPPGKRYHERSRRAVHLQLIELKHLAARTADWYVRGQHNGIEYRYPLLDKRIVEYMLKVPSHCLVYGKMERTVLRRLGAGLLPAEVVKRYSKEDPAISQRISSISMRTRKQFAGEFETYRNNPDLSFVDFELLEKNLPDILEATQNKDEKGVTSILYYLKKAHEFTRGYYG